MAEEIQVNFYNSSRALDGMENALVRRLMPAAHASLLVEGRSMRLEGLSQLALPALEAAKLTGRLRIKAVGLAAGIAPDRKANYLADASIVQMWVCLESEDAQG